MFDDVVFKIGVTLSISGLAVAVIGIVVICISLAMMAWVRT